MKQPKTTKEELIKDNAVLAKDRDDWANKFDKLRADFCKVLELSKLSDGYSQTYSSREITWSEIFAKIGELKAMDERYRLNDKIVLMNDQLSGANGRIMQLELENKQK
jgi:ribulose kinase